MRTSNMKRESFDLNRSSRRILDKQQRQERTFVYQRQERTFVYQHAEVQMQHQELKRQRELHDAVQQVCHVLLLQLQERCDM